MIKDNQKILNRLMILIDAFLIAFTFIGSYFFKFYILLNGPGPGVLPVSEYNKMIMVLVPLFLVVFSLFGVYEPMRTTKRYEELIQLVKASVVAMGIFLLYLFVIIKHTDYARSVLFFFFIFEIIFTGGFRFLLRTVLIKYRSKGYNQKHVLFVGYSRACEAYIDRISAHPEWGYDAFGILDNSIPVDTEYKNVKIIGTLDELETVLSSNDLDEVVVALALTDYDLLELVVPMCEKFGVHTKFVPDYQSIIPTKPITEDLLGLPVVNIRNVPLSNGLYALVKRLFDIAGSLFGIIITSPILLLIAILIKCTSKGPVLFKQERVGLHNKSFQMYKFRSMRVQTEAEEAKGWTTSGDPRVTKVGKFIRKASIDELPQLFNILKGDMSLVGPRPERPQFVEKFMEEIPRYNVKHQVRPGLTGWAQVNGYRGDTSIKKRIEHDIYYIENWTFGLDIKILFMTLFTGFFNKNAY